MQRIIFLKKRYIASIAFMLMTFSVFATDWKGTWNSTFGQMAISSTHTRNVTADMGDYILRGNITGNAANRSEIFSGAYMLKPGINKPVSQIQNHRILGARGVFSFKLDATKQKFSGTYTTESSNRNGKWNGVKVNVVNILANESAPSYNRPTIPPIQQEPVLWTGTWQTNKIGQLKIKWFSESHIEAKLFFKQGDYIRVADLKGGKDVTSGMNHKYFFGGPYKDSDGAEGRFYFTIDVNNDPSLNSMTGYIYIIDKKDKFRQLDPYSHLNIMGITGTRTSSATPNMNRYH